MFGRSVRTTSILSTYPFLITFSKIESPTDFLAFIYTWSFVGHLYDTISPQEQEEVRSSEDE